MTFTELMQTLATRLDIGDLEPNDQGNYELIFDEALTVQMQAIGRELFFIGTVGALPTDPEEATLRLKKMLQYNLARIRTRPEILCLESNTFILYRRLPLDSRIHDVELALEGYVNSLEFWQQAFHESPRVHSAPMFPFMFP